MFCTKCGSELKQDSTICHSCGTQNSAAAASLTSTVPANQPSYLVLPVKNSTKEKYTTFLFVTSMIFMIFFAIRTLSGLSVIHSWEALKETSGVPSDITEIISQLYNSVIVNVAIIVLTFIAVLVFFTMITSLRGNQDRTAEKKAKLSKILFRFSIVVTVLGILYFISDCVIYSQLNDFIDRASNYTQIDQDVLTELKSSATGSLAFDVTFIIFGIVNTIKASKLFKLLKNKEQQAKPTLQ